MMVVWVPSFALGPGSAGSYAVTYDPNVALVAGVYLMLLIIYIPHLALSLMVTLGSVVLFVMSMTIRGHWVTHLNLRVLPQ